MGKFNKAIFDCHARFRESLVVRGRTYYKVVRETDRKTAYTYSVKYRSVGLLARVIKEGERFSVFASNPDVREVA